jgi:zinc protease
LLTVRIRIFRALQVLNTVLGGYFGSRLMANIREDKGYTYGIGSGMSSFKQTGAFFIASEVGADVCKAAVVEIEKEVNLLKDEINPGGRTIAGAQLYAGLAY